MRTANTHTPTEFCQLHWDLPGPCSDETDMYSYDGPCQIDDNGQKREILLKEDTRTLPGQCSGGSY